MAITGISSYDGKQIIAAGAQSATKAYQDSNGDVITSKYQTTAGMSNYQTIAGMSEYATTASVTGKQDALTFSYTDSQISQINGSAIYSQGGGGGGYTGNVQQALDEVYGSSATWNTVTDKLDAASQVVTATGGTTTYVQTINSKNISATNAGSALSATNAYNLTNTAIKVASATSASTAYTLGNTAIKVASATSATNANTATYASNGVSLTDIYNSGRSGYAASAYIKNNVTANIGNWNSVYTAYTANSARWLRPAYTGYDYYSQGVNYITANNVGAAGFRFNPGNLLTTCSIQQWTYNEEQIGDNIYAIRFGLTMKNVVGTQWTHHTGVFTLSKGNFMEINTFNCGDGWNNTQIILKHDYSWSTSVDAILRDIRNSSTADNNTFTLYYTGMVST